MTTPKSVEDVVEEFDRLSHRLTPAGGLMLENDWSVSREFTKQWLRTTLTKVVEEAQREERSKTTMCDYNNLAKLIETYTIMAMNASGVSKEEAKLRARVVARCVIGDLEAEQPLSEEEWSV